MLAGITLTLVSLWYGQHHRLLPIVATEEATLVDSLFNFMLTIGTGLFILVTGVIIIAMIRFRRRSGDETDGPPIHGNVPLEILWTAIPTIIVLGIAIYSFNVYMLEGGGSDPMGHNMAHTAHANKAKLVSSDRPLRSQLLSLNDTGSCSDIANRNQQLQQEALQDPATASVRDASIPQRKEVPGAGVVSPGIGPTPENQGQPPEFVVNVTGLQFAWLFTYPEQNVISGELHLPVGQEVKLNISANDVIHAFWVPEFRLKQDAIPGRQTELRFTPNRVGEYNVICAELCGSYHSAMKTLVKVESSEQFDQWLQSQQQVANRPDSHALVAVSTGEAIATSSPENYLKPYAEELKLAPETLHQLKAIHSAQM